jgi:hypothetical protein
MWDECSPSSAGISQKTDVGESGIPAAFSASHGSDVSLSAERSCCMQPFNPATPAAATAIFPGRVRHQQNGSGVWPSLLIRPDVMKLKLLKGY